MLLRVGKKKSEAEKEAFFSSWSQEDGLRLVKLSISVVIVAVCSVTVGLLLYAISSETRARESNFEVSAEILQLKFRTNFIDIASRIISLSVVSKLDKDLIVSTLDDIARPLLEEADSFKWLNVAQVIQHKDRVAFEYELAEHVNSSYPEFSSTGPLEPIQIHANKQVAPESDEYAVVWYRYPHLQSVFGLDSTSVFRVANVNFGNVTCSAPFASQIVEIGTTIIPCTSYSMGKMGEVLRASGTLRVRKVMENIGVVAGQKLFLFDNTEEGTELFLYAIEHVGSDVRVLSYEGTQFNPADFGKVSKSFEVRIYDRVYALHVVATDEYLALNTGLYLSILFVLLTVFAVLLVGFLRSIQLYFSLHKYMEDNIEKNYIYLLGTMTHALRNPIHALTYYSESIKAGVTVLRDEETKSDDMETKVVRVNGDFMPTLDILWATVAHVHDICNSFMDYQQLTLTPLSLRYSECDLLQIVNEVVTQYRVFNKPRIEVTMKTIPNITKLEMSIDGLRFRQILGNGLSNSCKLTKSGSVTTILNFVKGADTPLSSIEADDKWYVSISILDTGIGIPESVLGKLFQHYERGMKPTNVQKNAASSGIGLVISRQLARLLDGEVTLSNRNDGEVGANFTIYIPIPNDRHAQSLETKAVPKEKHGPSTDPKCDKGIGSQQSVKKGATIPENISVWFAEDDYANNRIFHRMLARSGVQNVEGFFDGESVVQKFKDALEKSEALPNLIFLDIVMEGISGEETLSQLKKLGASMPMVAVTGNALPSDIENYINDGFADVVTKPFSTASLTQCIQKLVVQ